jgi:undecaprenyl-diphosphatase
MNIKNRVIILSILILLFFSIAFLVVNNNTLIINLDNAVKTFIESNQSPTIYSSMLSVTKIGDVFESLIIIMIFGLFLLSKNRKSLYIFVSATPLGILSTLLIKNLVQRARPYNLLEQGFGFPSSHATVATIFLLSSIFLIAPQIKNKFQSRLFLIVTSIIFPLVAFSRIYLSVHFTSDVIAGIILGLACFHLATICCHKKENVL